MSNYTSTSSFWPLTGDFLFQLGMGSDTKMQRENMMLCSLAFIQKPLLSFSTYIPNPSARPCPEIPTISVKERKKYKTGRKIRFLSVLCRWETDSVVKHGQAGSSEGIQDICMTLTDRASSRKPNTYSNLHSSRDLSSANASKP